MLPPYVNHILTCTGPEKTIKKLIAFLKEDNRTAFEFEHIISEPKELTKIEPIPGKAWLVVGEYLVDGTMNYWQTLIKDWYWWVQGGKLMMMREIRNYLAEKFQYTDDRSFIVAYISALKADSNYGVDYLEKCKEAYLRKKKYGYSDWFEWRMKNWGSEWDCMCRKSLDESPLIKVDKKTWQIAYPFITPWSVPYPIPKILSRKFPGISFKLQYAGEDEGKGTGFFEYKDGILIRGACYLPWTKDAWVNSLTVWGHEDEIPYLIRLKKGSWTVDYDNYYKDNNKNNNPNQIV